MSMFGKGWNELVPLFKTYKSEIRAPYDTDVYCVTCNKTQHVKAGEVLPFCCGRLMEILD